MKLWPWLEDEDESFVKSLIWSCYNDGYTTKEIKSLLAQEYDIDISVWNIKFIFEEELKNRLT